MSSSQTFDQFRLYSASYIAMVAGAPYSGRWRLCVGTAHALCHIVAALSLGLALELVIDMCVANGVIGWVSCDVRLCYSLTFLFWFMHARISWCFFSTKNSASGPFALYEWYAAFEKQHFPDPANLRQAMSTYTLGLYPAV
jgi:hypothetical protein